MALTAGIVGLPNVGKSTLFNAITKAGALAANYPFATIEPNVGTVLVPDVRLDELTRLVNPKQTVPTTFEFTDIAGLVRGASKGEGLGNQFLSHIRETDAICQVVRCFDDENITHVDGSVDPIRDVETINLELIFADIEVIEKRLPKIEKKAKLKQDNAHIEYNILAKIHEALLDNKPARTVDLDPTEYEVIKNFNLLTIKNIIYVANLDENDIVEPTSNTHYNNIVKYAKEEGSKVIPVCAQIEAELSELEEEDKLEFLQDMGLDGSGLDKLIREAYKTLGLETYFTAGEKEVRAWTYKKGMTAPQCAGVIHTDFERGFIRAETVAFEDLKTAGNMNEAKANGKVRQEGKDYIVQDGDVMLFKFNV